jgi:hypothetical protein
MPGLATAEMARVEPEYGVRCRKSDLENTLPSLKPPLEETRRHGGLSRVAGPQGPMKAWSFLMKTMLQSLGFRHISVQTVQQR